MKKRLIVGAVSFFIALSSLLNLWGGGFGFKFSGQEESDSKALNQKRVKEIDDRIEQLDTKREGLMLVPAYLKPPGSKERVALDQQIKAVDDEFTKLYLEKKQLESLTSPQQDVTNYIQSQVSKPFPSTVVSPSEATSADLYNQRKILATQFAATVPGTPEREAVNKKIADVNEKLKVLRGESGVVEQKATTVSQPSKGAEIVNLFKNQDQAQIGSTGTKKLQASLIASSVKDEEQLGGQNLSDGKISDDRIQAAIDKNNALKTAEQQPVQIVPTQEPVKVEQQDTLLEQKSEFSDAGGITIKPQVSLHEIENINIARGGGSERLNTDISTNEKYDLIMKNKEAQLRLINEEPEAVTLPSGTSALDRTVSGSGLAKLNDTTGAVVRKIAEDDGENQSSVPKVVQEPVVSPQLSQQQQAELKFKSDKKMNLTTEPLKQEYDRAFTIVQKAENTDSPEYQQAVRVKKLLEDSATQNETYEKRLYPLLSENKKNELKALNAERAGADLAGIKSGKPAKFSKESRRQALIKEGENKAKAEDDAIKNDQTARDKQRIQKEENQKAQNRKDAEDYLRQLQKNISKNDVDSNKFIQDNLDVLSKGDGSNQTQAMIQALNKQQKITTSVSTHLGDFHSQQYGRSAMRTLAAQKILKESTDPQQRAKAQETVDQETAKQQQLLKVVYDSTEKKLSPNDLETFKSARKVIEDIDQKNAALNKQFELAKNSANFAQANALRGKIESNDQTKAGWVNRRDNLVQKGVENPQQSSATKVKTFFSQVAQEVGVRNNKRDQDQLNRDISALPSSPERTELAAAFVPFSKEKDPVKQANQFSLMRAQVDALFKDQPEKTPDQITAPAGFIGNLGDGMGSRLGR